MKGNMEIMFTCRFRNGANVMKQIILSIVLFLVVSFVSIKDSTGSEEESPTRKSILVIFSYAPNTPAHSIILDGVRQKLYDSYGDKYNLYIEYLELEKYHKGDFPEEKFDLLNHKYEALKLDLLITVGYGSPSIIREFASRQIVSLPAISIDYDFSRYSIPADLLVNDRTTALGLKWDFGKTLSVALDLFPAAANVFYIGGSAKMDSLFLRLSKIGAKPFESSRKITYLTGLAMDQVLTYVRKLPENSIIIVSSFNADSRQVQYLYSEASKLISRAANAPVFVYADTALGDGEVGGYIVSFEKIGRLTGDVAVKILNGANPNSFNIDDKDIYDIIFDWRVLQKWNIKDDKLLPPGSTVIFQKQSFFEKYRWYIIAILVFIILQTVLIFNLIIMNRKHKIMNRLIQDSEDRYRKLVREDRIHGIGQLTSSLSHELNQPLTSILSNAQAGVRFIESQKIDESLMKEIFQNIVEDNKRASSILSSVRNIMKLENREKEKIDLRKVITEIVELCRSKITEIKSRLEVEMPSEPVCVIADSIQIQQVMLNLILNASQAIQKANGGSLIRITVRKELENVHISVIDNGTGIDPSILGKLFKTFVTSKKEGSGIGLNIARSIVEDHNGKIWAENVPSGGAKFSFYLKHCDD